MSSIMEKIKKGSTIKDSAILATSKFFTKKDMIPTDIPIINVALSGRLDGGLTPGLATMWAGPSKNFKTGFSLLMAKAYLDKYKDAAVLFYDSEFGSPQSYFESFGIDLNRVLHTPVTDIEQLKFDIMGQFENVERGDHLIVIIDSIGNLASKKEVEDAKDMKSVADMSRAKQIKSLFRMVTPHLNLKDIPMIVVNHTYKSIEMYSRDIVGGGCVVAGTNIQTTKGLKCIEDIEVGENVITLDGESPVTNIWNPNTLYDGTPECYEMEFDDGYKVICSEDHKFIVNGRWTEAKYLSPGDDCKMN